MACCICGRGDADRMHGPFDREFELPRQPHDQDALAPVAMLCITEKTSLHRHTRGALAASSPSHTGAAWLLSWPHKPRMHVQPVQALQPQPKHITLQGLRIQVPIRCFNMRMHASMMSLHIPRLAHLFTMHSLHRTGFPPLAPAAYI